MLDATSQMPMDERGLPSVHSPAEGLRRRASHRGLSASMPIKSSSSGTNSSTDLIVLNGYISGSPIALDVSLYDLYGQLYAPAAFAGGVQVQGGAREAALTYCWVDLMFFPPYP